MSSKISTVKSRCRKGVPESMRAVIWMKLSGADYLKKESPTLFDALCVTAGTVQENDRLWRYGCCSERQISETGRSGARIASEWPMMLTPHFHHNGSYFDIIERDLDRTFPHHSHFSEKEGAGQVGWPPVLCWWTHTVSFRKPLTLVLHPAFCRRTYVPCCVRTLSSTPN